MSPPTQGDRVGGRYRLERELGRSARAATWEAFDERLDRPVAVRIFDAGLDRRSLTKRAGQAAALTHPRAVRVFDTGFDAGRFFTVSELGSGSLSAVRLPLKSTEVFRLAIDIAEALDHAHERGVVHGHLIEGNVLLSSAGAKVGDFSFSADQRADHERDLTDLGKLLRRLLGARSGPVADDPPGFGPIVEGLADGAYDSAERVLADLRAVHPPETAEEEVTPRRWWIVFAVAALAVLSVFGLMRLGARSPHTRFAPGGHIAGQSLAITSLRDFDPLGDGRENPGTLDKIDDHNTQTFWSTERYAQGPNFSGLKAGVGVIFDLGSPSMVGKAQFVFPAAGCSFELRYTDNRSAPVDQWETAATVATSPPSAPIIFRAQRARFWLLWITRLTRGVPGAGRTYACAVSEAELFAP